MQRCELADVAAPCSFVSLYEIMGAQGQLKTARRRHRDSACSKTGLIVLLE